MFPMQRGVLPLTHLGIFVHACLDELFFQIEIPAFSSVQFHHITYGKFNLFEHPVIKMTVKTMRTAFFIKVLSLIMPLSILESSFVFAILGNG